jgi:protein-tyrosine phosphatase
VTRDSTGGDLDLDVARLRTLGVDVLLLLVEDDELAWCHVPELPAVIRAAGIELVRFAIRDPRVPTDDAAFRTVVEDLVARLRAGGSVAIACRGGIDRSGMAAGGVLVSAGLDLGDATDRIHAGRRGSLSGPLAGLFGGADISYFVRFLVAGVLYVAPSRPSRRVQGDS